MSGQLLRAPMYGRQAKHDRMWLKKSVPGSTDASRGDYATLPLPTLRQRSGDLAEVFAKVRVRSGVPGCIISVFMGIL